MERMYQQFGYRVRYGLWRMHRCYRLNYGTHLAADAVDGCNRPIPNWATRDHAVTIFACVSRWMRIRKDFRASTWNRLVEIVASRCSGNPSRTIAAMQVSDRHPGRPVVFRPESASARFYFNPSPFDVTERLRSLAAARALRISRTCECCSKFDTAGPRVNGVAPRHGLYFPPSMRDEGDNGHWKPKTLCVSCWNRFKPIYKRAREFDSTRILINRVKKEIANEQRNQNQRTAA